LPAHIKFDWPSIRKEYEASDYSTCALAKRHGLSEGAIRKKAKAEGWVNLKDMGGHIEQKVVALQKVKDFEAKEKRIGNEQLVKKINDEVHTRLSLIETYSKINQKITNRLLGYLDHDARILQDPDRPIDLHELGKLKMASEILKNTRQTSIGDAPLMEMTEAELADKEDDLQFAIVVPAQEVKRIEAIKAKK